MKTIKSALLGAKSIIDHHPDAMLFQLKEIIKAHRALIITRLLGELPTYLDYKFQYKPDRDTLVKIKEQLLTLKSAGVELRHYDNVVQQLLNRAVVHLTNEPFYTEIDEQLKALIVTPQLKLA